MRRTLTILLVGALVAVLAIGGLAPAVSAHSGTDEEQPTPYADAENATDARAQYMAEWMEARMGPEGVESFEQQTGTTVEEVAGAMAEYMGPRAGTWNDSNDDGQYAPGPYGDYRAPGSGYGPQMPCGGGYGHGMWGGSGPSAGYGNGGYGPGAGYGMGGHGPGMGGMGGMGGGW